MSIPVKYTQPGHDVSPALSWDKVPDGTESFVLIARDLDSITPAGADGFLHWLLWNIPKTARSLAEGVPVQEQLADGTRQISSSGPYYKGPAWRRRYDPAHLTITFEIYAVSTAIPVIPRSASRRRSPKPRWKPPWPERSSAKACSPDSSSGPSPGFTIGAALRQRGCIAAS